MVIGRRRTTGKFQMSAMIVSQTAVEAEIMGCQPFAGKFEALYACVRRIPDEEAEILLVEGRKLEVSVFISRPARLAFNPECDRIRFGAAN